MVKIGVCNHKNNMLPKTLTISPLSGNIAVLNENQYIVISQNAAHVLISYQKPIIIQLVMR